MKLRHLNKPLGVDRKEVAVIAPALCELTFWGETSTAKQHENQT